MRLANERRPALILMDIQLPGINGVEALRQLRADPMTSAIPVIAVTASVMTQDRTRIMAAGFDGFHGKPISVRQLLATVREILDKPRAGSLPREADKRADPSSTVSKPVTVQGVCDGTVNLSKIRGCVYYPPITTSI